ncbi:putative protein N(5)-glutamine methyltransferase [Streptomyces sp. PT12]|uniref:putative protein N(5)-glutamine methyltransferase n=1 Tax=Streptomyces sp. PT12 TaxID=1510197 RepID=UPI000DE38546|nr:putative protein N(5)-glutamine methyltransferase [Streptomyces sp. PT12]RBM13153.1 putative protein N(5)-glutamine methyltransferase [Streptomyces sp. PT12]
MAGLREAAARLRAAGCVFADEEARLLIEEARTPERLATLVERRAAGHPLEQVLGWAAFHGLRIAVEPGVFVPRRRTEALVDRAIALAPERPVIVDLCCGSGAIAAALAAALTPRELHAADRDPAAVRCARRNLAATGAQVHQGDLFAALPRTLRGRIDILTANVPYVPTANIPLLPAEARDHEPHPTLDGGPDGLAILRRVMAEAPAWLSPTGHALTETAPAQAEEAARAIRAAGLTPTVTTVRDTATTVIDCCAMTLRWPARRA